MGFKVALSLARFNYLSSVLLCTGRLMVCRTLIIVNHDLEFLYQRCSCTFGSQHEACSFQLALHCLQYDN